NAGLHLFRIERENGVAAFRNDERAHFLLTRFADVRRARYARDFDLIDLETDVGDCSVRRASKSLARVEQGRAEPSSASGGDADKHDAAGQRERETLAVDLHIVAAQAA